MSFSAETGTVPPLAWYLLLINTVWSVIYDTLYAMVDREDDRLAGVKSTAILFGRYDVPIVAVLMLLMWLLLFGVGVKLQLTWPWFLGLAAAGALFIRQLVQVKGRDREACFHAFLNNNWVGLVIFAGLAGHFWLEGQLFS